MKPPEDATWRLSRDWLAKASTDLPVCERLFVEGAAFSEAIAFHAQQATKESIKELLVARQVEFPKAHDIERLLKLVAHGDGPLSRTLADAAELTPYGVAHRYPGEYTSTTTCRC